MTIEDAVKYVRVTQPTHPDSIYVIAIRGEKAFAQAISPLVANSKSSIIGETLKYIFKKV